MTLIFGALTIVASAAVFISLIIWLVELIMEADKPDMLTSKA